MVTPAGSISKLCPCVCGRIKLIQPRNESGAGIVTTIISCHYIDFAVVGDGSCRTPVAVSRNRRASGPRIGNRIVDVDVVEILLAGKSALPCSDHIDQSIQLNGLEVVHLNGCGGSTRPGVGDGIVYLDRPSTSTPTDEIIFVASFDIGIFMAGESGRDRLCGGKVFPDAWSIAVHRCDINEVPLCCKITIVVGGASHNSDSQCVSILQGVKQGAAERNRIAQGYQGPIVHAVLGLHSTQSWIYYKEKVEVYELGEAGDVGERCRYISNCAIFVYEFELGPVGRGNRCKHQVIVLVASANVCPY